VESNDLGSVVDGEARSVRSYPSVDWLPAHHYRHVYLSPHFDDVALSAGGTLLGQTARGAAALVVAVCTARPPGEVTAFAEFQHDRWGGAADPWAEREEEEQRAMSALGVDYLWLGLPDAIYRGDQYLSDDDLFGPVQPGDALLAVDLAARCRDLAGRAAEATFYLPLGVGGHVDHQLCYDLVGPLVAAGCSVLFYEDIPYALDKTVVDRRLSEVRRTVTFKLEPEILEIGDLIAAKCRAVDLYTSQVPWIFRDYGPAGSCLRRQAASLSREGGYAERFWRPHHE
jgi:LmbE family N-acetylglucosaminyl deacetylase